VLYKNDAQEERKIRAARTECPNEGFGGGGGS
jgi:hypothetical protein